MSAEWRGSDSSCAAGPEVRHDGSTVRSDRLPVVATDPAGEWVSIPVGAENTEVDERGAAGKGPPASGSPAAEALPLERGVAAPDPSEKTLGNDPRLDEASPVGRLIGDYRIEREVGRGGMGVVYLAFHTKLRRRVALKVMLSARLASDKDRRRFIREAEACASLKHPNIVPVYDIGVYEGRYYFTMDFVEGCTLRQWVAERKPRIDEVVRLLAGVADAVGYAHGKGIIHRDLKPVNVLVDAENVPHVMDFGLAKRERLPASPGAIDPAAAAEVPPFEFDSLATVDGAIIGTPHYMSPEQAAGRIDEVDVRTDVFALGVILYEVLGGELPFRGASAHEIIRKITSEDPVPLRKRNPEVPRDLELIVGKAMAKERDRRYRSAFELKDDLERWLANEPVRARPAGPIYRARKWVDRNRALAAAALAGLSAVVAVGGYLRYERRAEAAKLMEESRTIFENAKAAVSEFRRAGSSRDWRRLLETPARAALEKAKSSLEQAHVLHATPELEALRNQVLEEAGRVKGIIDEQLRAEEERLRAREMEAMRQREYAARLAEAEAQAALAALDRPDDPAAIATAQKALTDARVKLLAAGEQQVPRGSLDERGRALERRLDALAARLEEEARRVEERSKAREDLNEGRGLLRAAKASAADPAKAIELAFSAARAFRAARLDVDLRADATAGLVEAMELEASVATASRDWSLARKLAAELAELDLTAAERVKGRLADAQARERDFQEAFDAALVAAAEDRHADAVAGFRKALLYGPGEPRAEVRLRLSEASLACAAASHEEELRLLVEARSHASAPRVPPELSREVRRRINRAGGEVSAALQERALLAAKQGRFAEADAAVAGIAAIGGERAAASAAEVRALIDRWRELPAGFVLVPGGPFPYGAIAGAAPREVAAFAIGRAEVTAADFAEFVAAGGYAALEHWDEAARPLLPRFVGLDGRPGPAGWSGGAPPAGTEALPVAGVSWYEARAYCRWRGGGLRLPSEVEWEKAATWAEAEGRKIVAPWLAGDASSAWPLWEARFAAGGTRPAGEPFARRNSGAPLVDVSPSGCVDMFGNVHEWCTAEDGTAVARGPSFRSRFEERALGTRRYVPDPAFRGPNIGFRVAR